MKAELFVLNILHKITVWAFIRQIIKPLQCEAVKNSIINITNMLDMKSALHYYKIINNALNIFHHHYVHMSINPCGLFSFYLSTLVRQYTALILVILHRNDIITLY